MNKGLEALKEFKNQQQGVNVYADDCLRIIEQDLNVLDNLLGHVTDLYMKRELDYYADREPFYYDYYIVFDNTPLKVSKDLYDKVRKQLDLPNKCVDW